MNLTAMTIRTTLLIAIVAATASASFAAADRVKIYVFAAPATSGESFLGGVLPAALADSVRDLREAVEAEGAFRHWYTKKREDAAIFVQVVGREESGGEYHVRAHITTRDGRAADLTGTSAHQWKQSAKDLAHQLVTWAKAHEAEIPLPK